MSFLSVKNIVIVGFLLLLLIGIPIGVYLVQQQQQTESQAEQSSVLSFVPVSSEASPIEVAVGDEFKLDITVNPGTNKVSVVAFEINYDPTLFAPSETTPFAENKTAFPVIMDQPVYEDGIIRGKVSTQNVQTAVTTTTKVATITFVALAESPDPSTISYGAPFTQILSAGTEDEAAENVLSSTNPAFIITTSSEITPTNDPSITPSVTPNISTTPQPTTIVQASPTTLPKGGPGNTAPACTGLSANGALSGVSPFAASFTATANDPDGNVEKVTFNFGDGQVKDVTTTNQGVASGSATTASTEHTYTTAGTYQVNAIATDNKGDVSAEGACVLTMTITSPVSPTQTPDAPTPTLEPTGPAETFIGIGIVAGILTFLGGLLFFTL